MRYLLFAGEDYYPAGGFDDFVGSYDTMEQAKETSLDNKNWAHIVSISVDGTIVQQATKEYGEAWNEGEGTHKGSYIYTPRS